MSTYRVSSYPSLDENAVSTLPHLAAEGYTIRNPTTTYSSTHAAIKTGLPRTLPAVLCRVLRTRTVALSTFIAIWTLLQHFVFSDLLSHEKWVAVFAFQASNPEYLWTWITVLFSHQGLVHLSYNLVALFAMGILAELFVTTPDRTLKLFFIFGIFATLTHYIHTLLFATSYNFVVGASGAVAGLTMMTIIAFPTDYYGFPAEPIANPYLRSAFRYSLLAVQLGFIITIFLLFDPIVADSLPYLPQQFIPSPNPDSVHSAHVGGLVVGAIYGLYLRLQS